MNKSHFDHVVASDVASQTLVAGCLMWIENASSVVVTPAPSADVDRHSKSPGRKFETSIGQRLAARSEVFSKI